MINTQSPSILNRGNNSAIAYLFLATLIGTLMQGEYLAIARISWVLLAFLFAIKETYILYACFFFASFFHSAGFAPDFVFTIKHFHIALGIGWAGTLIQKGMPCSVYSIRKVLWYFFPFFLIVAFGLLNYLRISPTLTSVRIPFNILLTMSCAAALIFIIFGQITKANSQGLLKNCLLYLSGGVFVQIALGILNHVFKTDYLNIVIFHNNHIGILSVLGFFFAAAAYKCSSSGSYSRYISFLFTVVLFLGVLLSCSRTSWISFAIGYSTFLIISKRYIEVFKWKEFVSMPSRKRLIISSLIGLTIGLSFINQSFYNRIINMDQLINPSYWDYIIADTQNFGCFGIYRLRDLQNVVEGLRTNPLIGVGFTRTVVNIHGFLFLTLSATGIIGLVLLISFGVLLLSKLWHYIRSKAHYENRFFALAGLCTMISWFFISLMESYFLQFIVWINFCVIIYVLEHNNILESKHTNPPQRQ